MTVIRMCNGGFGHIILFAARECEELDGCARFIFMGFARVGICVCANEKHNYYQNLLRLRPEIVNLVDTNRCIAYTHC